MNDNERLEPNTGARDKNPVPFSKDGNQPGLQGLNIIAVALIIVLAAAIMHLARN